jgi:hypothetical protein
LQAESGGIQDSEAHCLSGTAEDVHGQDPEKFASGSVEIWIGEPRFLI